MNAALALGPSSRVTVIDDDEDGREELMEALRDFNFEPVPIVGEFGTEIGRLLAEVEAQNSSFVICDHRLQPKQMAQFYGVELVRQLIDRKRPAMLLTMYGSSDRLELRQSRHAVPVIVARDAFQANRISNYFDICQREIEENPVDERRAHRTLIRIDGVSKDNPKQLDAVIPSWRPEHAVPILLESIDPKIHATIAAGCYLLGDVNVGARSEDELFFKNVNEVAPPPKESLA